MIRSWRAVAVATLFFGAGQGLTNRVFAQTVVQGSSLREGLINLGDPLGSGQPGAIVATLTDIEVSTAPLGTSTGGFTFTFDPALRTWKRSASSFGPTFAERALTTGRGRFSVAFNYLHSTYDSLEGFNLRNGELQPAVNIQGDPFRTVATSLQLNMSSDTVVAYGHLGVTDDVDIGVAVPWVRVSVDGVGRGLSATGATLQTVTLLPASSSGIGDTAIFGKYRFWHHAEGGLAVALDVHVPTGDKNNLRGLDITRTLVSGIWSRGGRVSPHLNAGYEFWSKSVSATGDVLVKNQVQYAAGVEIEAHPRVTALVDLVGRQLMKGGALEYRHFSATGSADVLVAAHNGIHQLALAPGIKLNAFQNLLVTGNVLVSLNQRGLRATATTVVGIDWAF